MAVCRRARIIKLVLALVLTVALLYKVFFPDKSEYIYGILNHNLDVLQGVS